MPDQTHGYPNDPSGYPQQPSPYMQPEYPASYPPPPPPPPYQQPQAYPPPPPPPGYMPAAPGYVAPLVAPGTPVAVAGTNGFATASLVCSLLGLCVGFSAILGVIFGHIALSQIARSNNMQQGRGLAMAGLIIGYIEIGLGVIWIAFLIIASASNAGSVSLLSALVR